MKLTTNQKRFRKLARQLGRTAIRYIRNAIYPVYEDDAVTYTDLAVRFAREAWHTARLSEAP